MVLGLGLLDLLLLGSPLLALPHYQPLHPPPFLHLLLPHFLQLLPEHLLPPVQFAEMLHVAPRCLLLWLERE